MAVGKNTRHVAAVIGLAHGVADSIEESYGDSVPKTVAGYIEKIRKRSLECFDLWPDSRRLEEKEERRIQDRVNSVLRVTVTGRHGKGEVAALTSLALALLDDLKIAASKDKRPTIERLITAYRETHRNYDRRLDKWHCYDAAVAAVKKLEQIEA